MHVTFNDDTDNDSGIVLIILIKANGVTNDAVIDETEAGIEDRFLELMEIK